MNNRQNQSLVEKFEDLIIYKNFQIDDVLEKKWLEKFISFQTLKLPIISCLTICEEKQMGACWIFSNRVLGNFLGEIY